METQYIYLVSRIIYPRQMFVCSLLKRTTRCRGGNDKITKKIYCPFGFFHLGSLGIYFDKMDPNFQKKMTRSAPLEAPMIIVLGFVSDWTSDSHLTHYLPCKTMVFQCRPKLQSVYIHDIYLPLQL